MSDRISELSSIEIDNSKLGALILETGLDDCRGTWDIGVGSQVGRGGRSLVTETLENLVNERRAQHELNCTSHETAALCRLYGPSDGCVWYPETSTCHAEVCFGLTKVDCLMATKEHRLSCQWNEAAELCSYACEKPIEIVFVLDFSSSMWETDDAIIDNLSEKMYVQREFLKELMDFAWNRSPLNNDTYFSVVSYSAKNWLEIDWERVGDKVIPYEQRTLESYFQDVANIYSKVTFQSLRSNSDTFTTFGTFLGIFF